MIQRQVYPFHADEDVAGVLLNADGEVMFTCERKRGHPVSGPYAWLQAPEPPDLGAVSGLAEELGLHVGLPAAIAKYAEHWVEYGVVEAAYADANPRDFAYPLTGTGIRPSAKRGTAPRRSWPRRLAA